MSARRPRRRSAWSGSLDSAVSGERVLLPAQRRLQVLLALLQDRLLERLLCLLALGQPGHRLLPGQPGAESHRVQRCLARGGHLVARTRAGRHRLLSGDVLLQTLPQLLG